MKKLTNEGALSLKQIYMLEVKQYKSQPKTINYGFIKTGVINRTMLVHALSNDASAIGIG